ncbi:hypothetical protein [Streptacidiphilus neutrinimicus]|uniref:hypothetical protein n=1 Tax=Streptacidiphilus neutrinimicus TaxID=105420 RepID=UPI001377E1EC|nr:hypothetical protein [Streptacidiphilus neutrinimicus]
MSDPQEREPQQADDETREESSKQRNITAPTPPDVRAKKRDGDEDEGASTDPKA